MIVQKLGYGEDEVRKYVRHDPDSFVGVLYQKLLEDQLDRTAEHNQKGNPMTQSISSSEHNISAKLPI
jgi:hypothetical protein